MYSTSITRAVHIGQNLHCINYSSRKESCLNAISSVSRCSHDYVDVFTQVLDPYQNLLNVPLHGRYCGSEPEELPHLLVSMYSNFILGFYSDSKGVDHEGFNASYSFIDDGNYFYYAIH